MFAAYAVVGQMLLMGLRAIGAVRPHVIGCVGLCPAVMSRGVGCPFRSRSAGGHRRCRGRSRNQRRGRRDRCPANHCRRLGFGIFHHPPRVAVHVASGGDFHAGIIPSWNSRFSAFVLRCFAAATMVAPMIICLPMARNLALTSGCQSAGNAPRSRACRMSRWYVSRKVPPEHLEVL